MDLHLAPEHLFVIFGGIVGGVSLTFHLSLRIGQLIGRHDVLTEKVDNHEKRIEALEN